MLCAEACAEHLLDESFVPELTLGTYLNGWMDSIEVQMHVKEPPWKQFPTLFLAAFTTILSLFTVGCEKKLLFQRSLVGREDLGVYSKQNV